MILFPMLASIIFNVAIGGDIKDVNIAVLNNEVADCRNSIVNGSCFYDIDRNFTLSCEILHGLEKLQYNLVIFVNNCLTIFTF